MIKNESGSPHKFLTKWLHKNFKRVFTLLVIITAIILLVVKIICVTTKSKEEKGVTETVISSQVVTTVEIIEEQPKQELEEKIKSTTSTTEIEDEKEITEVEDDVESGEITANDTTTSITEDEVSTTYFDVPLSKEIQDYIFKIADEYEIPAELIFATIEIESNFNPNVISKTNDYGLCQINICNHEWLKENLGLDNMLDPYQNIKASAYMYSDKLKSTDGDIGLAAMAYNCGSGGAQKLWNQGIYSTSYSRKLVNTYNKYKEA